MSISKLLPGSDTSGWLASTLPATNNVVQKTTRRRVDQRAPRRGLERLNVTMDVSLISVQGRRAATSTLYRRASRGWGGSPPVRDAHVRVHSREWAERAVPRSSRQERTSTGRLWRRGSRPAAWEARGWARARPRARIPGSGTLVRMYYRVNRTLLRLRNRVGRATTQDSAEWHPKPGPGGSGGRYDLTRPALSRGDHFGSGLRDGYRLAIRLDRDRDPAVADREDNGVRPIRRRELVRDRPEVVTNRLLADPQDLPDLAVGATASNMLEDLELSISYRTGWRGDTSIPLKRREPEHARIVRIESGPGHDSALARG